MLNYSNLNDVEFESLCKDIMERMLGVSLRRFAPGKDGGVDLTDDVSTKSTIVQVKHYRNSTTDKLVSSLKKELSKVSALAPQQYYICCSRELSPANINELFQCFQNYMSSDRHIITLIEIDDFLKKASNRDILKKHFKLWLDDTGILNELNNDKLFVDCEAFLEDAKELHKLFVHTRAFDSALKVLEDGQTLCIIGDPGVGKSITSKMLVLYYASQNYRVRYTSNVTDLATLKSSLRNEPDEKEVILLDDCFGQAYFEMQTAQSSELISLIKYVKKHPNKILILNSRVTIFKEAQRRQRDIVECLERNNFKVHILDINELSPEEKAKILYNHLAFSNLPDDYFDNIRVEKRYMRIINHGNFNPRIIEYVCNPNRYNKVPASEFFLFFKKHLDTPSEMWKDEYDDRLRAEDRILLQTIYSLTATTINAELVRQCFDRRIFGIPTIDKTVDQFERAMQRLNGGFIKILDNKGIREISMQNPSVNDFLDGRFKRNGAERDELLSSIYSVNQLRLLSKAERVPYIINLLETGKIEQIIFSKSEDRSALIGHYILASGVCMEQYRSEVLNYIIHRPYQFLQYNSLLSGALNIKKQILNAEIWEFYNLKAFFEKDDHLYTFLSFYELDAGVDFICSIDDFFHGKNRIFYAQQVEKYLVESIDEFCNVDAANYEHILDVEAAVQLAQSWSPDGCDIDEDYAAATLDEKVREEAFSEFERIISKLPENFRYLADHVEEDDLIVEGSDSLVEEFLSVIPGHYEHDDDRERDNQLPYSPIDAIFQR